MFITFHIKVFNLSDLSFRAKKKDQTKKKSREPSILSWGTPHDTSIGSEMVLFTDTN
jgi:hypothetical protein